MEALDEFPEEFSKCFKYSFIVLKNCNIRYLKDDRSFIKKYWRFLYICPAVLLHFSALFANLVIMILSKRINGVAEVLPQTLIVMQATLKAICIIPKTAEISMIIQDLGVMWRTNYTVNQTKDKNKILKGLNFYNRVIYWGLNLGVAQFSIAPIMETLIRRYVLQQHFEFGLPVPASYPFDITQNWFSYLAVYLHQCYASFHFARVHIGSESMLITLCGLLTNEFWMLGDDLARTTPTRNNSASDDDRGLRDVIKKHQKLIELSRQLDNVFNGMIFIDLLFTGITTCAFTFAGNFADGLMYTITSYLGQQIIMGTIFLACYYANLLTDASARINEVAYNTSWYRASLQYRKTIWLISMISQKPRGLTSFKYAAVSLVTFTKVVSTTWSYFSLMKTAYSGGDD